MCVTAVILAAASLVGTAATTVGSIVQNNNASSLAEYQARVAETQGRDAKSLLELQTAEAEVARSEEYRRVRAQALASVAGSNIENRSFIEGIQAADDRAFGRDISAIRINAGVQRNRLSDQIAVTRTQSNVTKANASLGNFAAIGAGIAGVAKAADVFNTFSVPKKGS